MSEKNILINNREIVMPVFAKGRFAMLIRFLSGKFQAVSDFVHKWVKP